MLSMPTSMPGWMALRSTWFPAIWWMTPLTLSRQWIVPPFHTKYVSVRIAGKEDDVLLLKQFMKGVHVYGSELRVGGFSGYLTELLVLCYGSFVAVLRAASSWRPGQRLDLEGHAAVRHDEPLIVVDPVDPRRNVAGALTLDKMLQFAGAARSFLAEPEA